MNLGLLSFSEKEDKLLQEILNKNMELVKQWSDIEYCVKKQKTTRERGSSTKANSVASRRIKHKTVISLSSEHLLFGTTIANGI